MCDNICVQFSDPVWSSTPSTSRESRRKWPFLGIEYELQLSPWLPAVHPCCVNLWGQWDVDRRHTTVSAWVHWPLNCYFNSVYITVSLSCYYFTLSPNCICHWSRPVWWSWLSWWRIQRGQHLFLPVSVKSFFTDAIVHILDHLCRITNRMLQEKY